MIELLQKFHNDQIYRDRHNITPVVVSWATSEGISLNADYLTLQVQTDMYQEPQIKHKSENITNFDRYPYIANLIPDQKTITAEQIISELDEFTQRNNPIRFLEDATDITFEERNKIRQDSQHLAKEAEIGRNRQILLEMLFENTQVWELAQSLETEYVSIKHSPQLLDHPTVDNLIRLMLPKSDKFGFQLAFLLSIIPQPDIPELQEYLNHEQTRDDAKIVLDKLDWFLCEQAEDRFEDSLDKGAVVLINDKIVMKVKGKMTGLCVKSFLTASGHGFTEGHMYSPLNIQVRNQIKRAFDQGESRIDLENDVWGYMREYKDFDGSGFEDVVDKSKNYAAEAPEKLPERIDGMTRKQFRLDEQEAHN